MKISLSTLLVLDILGCFTYSGSLAGKWFSAVLHWLVLDPSSHIFLAPKKQIYVSCIDHKFDLEVLVY